jgi:hypothetical protein
MEPFSPCGVVCGKLLTEEDAMEAALERIMLAYDLLANDRLALCGLTYLRERDGRFDPVRAGYTGL